MRSRLLSQSGETRRIITARERIRSQIGDRGVGQRMMRNVHVQLLIVRHGPRNAKLVRQIVPEPAVPLPRYDAAVEAGRRTGSNIPRIDVKPLKQRFAGPGQLLYGIHDHDVVRNAEVLDQICVRDFVDARLVSAEIDGDPVGFLMVQCGQHPLPRRHCFLGHRPSP